MFYTYRRPYGRDFGCSLGSGEAWAHQSSRDRSQGPGSAQEDSPQQMQPFERDESVRFVQLRPFDDFNYSINCALISITIILKTIYQVS